jgi:hypothetical protein
MLSDRITNLAPPPRDMPLAVMCAALMGLTGTLGALLLIFGAAAMWIFLGDLNLVGEWRLNSAAATAPAVITSVSWASYNSIGPIFTFALAWAGIIANVMYLLWRLAGG